MTSWAWLAVQALLWSLTALLSTLWWLWLHRPRTNAPGPPTLPILGNLLHFRKLPVLLSKFREMHRQYGDIFRCYVGSKLVVFVAHPDDVQHVMLTAKLCERDSYTTRTMRHFVGDGLLTLSGNEWKAHRKMINPIFNSELLMSILDAVHEGAVSLCGQLVRSNGAPTDVYPLAFLSSMHTVSPTILGCGGPDIPSLDIPEEGELPTLVIGSMHAMQEMLARPWMQLKFFLRLSSSGRDLIKYVEMGRQDTVGYILARAAASAEESHPRRRLRMLETLVKPGGEMAMSLGHVRDELITMALTASETTASTINYALSLLALHPEWQDAVHQELREVFGGGEDYMRAPTDHDLGRLRVLESVIKETLRLYPPASSLPRQAVEDLHLARGRVVVPKGALIVVAPFLTHRHPDFFPDPDRFDPGRFLDGDAGKRHLCCYFPFGLGQRNCVGLQYARLHLRIYLAAVLRQHRVLPHSSREELERVTLSITAHPLEPLKVSFVPLETPNTATP